MATLDELYDALAMADDPGADAQFLGFATNGMQIAGGATIRQIITGLGYDDPGRTRITDAALVSEYRALAQDISESITQTFNDMLRSALGRMDTLPDTADAARAALSDFYDAVHVYNRDTLQPYMLDTARQGALSAFYDNNTSPATGATLAESVDWTWTQQTEFDDDCAAADAASPAPKSTLTDIAGGEPPVHHNCGCTLDPGDLDAADLPAQADLWTGQDAAYQATEPQTFTDGVKRGQLRVIALDLDDTALSPALAPVLMPLVRMLRAHGVEIGVLTGNNSWNGGAARNDWDALGYPEPDWSETHTHQDTGKLPAWKAQQCNAHEVDLIVDDFKHGAVLPTFLKAKPANTQIFQIPYPPHAPEQDVGNA